MDRPGPSPTAGPGAGNFDSAGGACLVTALQLMSVNLPYLLLALLLLWFPRQWMRLGLIVRRRRRREAAAARKSEPWNRREPGDPRMSFPVEIAKGRNFVDLLRGAAGGLAVVGGYGLETSIALVEGAGRVAALQLFWLKVAILFTGVLLQTLRYEHQRVTFFAPVFFLAGLSVSLCGHWGALFAFLLVWSINPMLGNAQGFLAVYALLLGAFGLLFRGFAGKLPLVALALCLAPVLLSLLSGRPLIVLTRKGTHIVR
jgi:hypothetical protein